MANFLFALCLGCVLGCVIEHYENSKGSTVITYHNGRLKFWFRIFGYGLCFRKKSYTGKHQLTFSMRNGKTKYLKTPWHIITFIRPPKRI